MSDYTIVKHRDSLSLAYRDPERGRVRIALGTTDKGLAEARARELWQVRSRPESEYVKDIWQAYVKDKAVDKVDVDPSGSTWKVLEPSFGHQLAEEISRDDCRAHYEKRKKLKRSDSTIRKELEMLRAALYFRYGKGNGPKIWMPPPSKPRSYHLTKEKLTEFFNTISTPHIRLFVALAIVTGARMTAILELTWDRVDLDLKIIDLNPQGRHETNKRRSVVPINDRAYAELIRAKATATTEYVIEHEGRAPLASVKKAMANAARKAGIPVSPHVLRHSAGVWMAQADVPMQKIAQYMGHTSPKVTESVYARYSPNFMKDASDALEF